MRLHDHKLVDSHQYNVASQVFTVGAVDLDNVLAVAVALEGQVEVGVTDPLLNHNVAVLPAHRRYHPFQQLTCIVGLMLAHHNVLRLLLGHVLDGGGVVELANVPADTQFV